MKQVNFGIRYINDQTALVSKAFMNKATIFGTEEFKVWREYKKEFPQATMKVKKINVNEDQKRRRNKTYENMEAFINTQTDKVQLLAEFQTVKECAKIQRSPYQFVLGWFEARFEGYDKLKTFMAEKDKERTAAEKAKAAAATEASEEVEMVAPNEENDKHLTIAKGA